MLTIAQTELAEEALRQTAHRTDGTFIAVCVLIACVAGGVGMYLTVNKVLSWFGAKVVEPTIAAGVAHLNRVGDHLDRMDEAINRNTEALESLGSTLSNLQCNQPGMVRQLGEHA